MATPVQQTVGGPSYTLKRLLALAPNLALAGINWGGLAAHTFFSHPASVCISSSSSFCSVLTFSDVLFASFLITPRHPNIQSRLRKLLCQRVRRTCSLQDIDSVYTWKPLGRAYLLVMLEAFMYPCQTEHSSTAVLNTVILIPLHLVVVVVIWSLRSKEPCDEKETKKRERSRYRKRKGKRRSARLRFRVQETRWRHVRRMCQRHTVSCCRGTHNAA